MKKDMFYKIVLILLSICFITPAFAKYKARSLNTNRNNVNNGVAICDQNGDVKTVGADHHIGKREGVSYVNSDSTSLAAGTLVQGACTVYDIIVRGVTAGDYVYIYDAMGENRGTMSGINLVAEICVGTANDTNVISFSNGLKFLNDVGFTATDGDVDVRITVDD